MTFYDLFCTFANEMKRLTLFILFFGTLTLLSAQPKHEVRAVWLTVLGNLDWPSGSLLDGKSVADQKQELIGILDELKAINVNTVLLHTRIRSNTLYPSDIEPWAPYLSGKAGVSPGCRGHPIFPVRLVSRRAMTPCSLPLTSATSAAWSCTPG